MNCADRQRTYARRVLRAASAALISATSVMDTLTRTARTSAEEYERVAAQRTASQQDIGALRSEIASCEAQIDGMTESEAYKQGRELDGLRLVAVGLSHHRAAFGLGVHS